MKKFISTILALFAATHCLFAEVTQLGKSVTSELSDKNAIENTQRLYKYLRDNYGQKVITGIMENAWNDGFNMLEKVHMETGKYAALTGFDFMNYTGMGYSVGNQQTERAVQIWSGEDYKGNKLFDKPGIVSFMWHWRDPMAQAGKTGEFNAEKANFRIPYDTNTKTWKTDTPEYKKMIKDMDVIAKQLKLLQRFEVPVLWRPLHEGAGNVGLYNKTGKAWFWWGAGNEKGVETNEDICGECYVALWRLMYTYFTETKKLHNLIWVWNGQNGKFYPGAEYVDIIGSDIYNTPKNYISNKANFTKFQAYDNTKMVTLSECGVIPSMDNIVADEAWWSYFMVWNDGKNEKSEAEGQFWYGERYNPVDHKKSVYDSQIAITWDELPDLTKYE